LKPGDTLRYRVEVRDRRPKSEAIFSKDFAVRIAEDPNAVDKLLDAFEKSHDTFRDKLVNLIAEQKKVKEKIDQVRTKYDALNTKVQAAIEEAKAKSKDDTPPPPIEPKDAAEMAALRMDLTDLFGQEQKNVAAALALDQELRNLAAQAQKNSLLDAMIGKEMQDLSGQFKSSALDPLQELANKLQQGTNPAQSMPDLKNVKNQSDRVQKNLESMKNRLDALANAQKGTKTDVDKALAKLKEDLLKEHGRMTARDLEELKDFLKNLREELAKLQGKQEDLAEKTEEAADSELPEIEKKQLSLDELLKKDLELAKKILEREKTRSMRKPQFPDDPFIGEPKGRTAPKQDNAPPNGPKSQGENANPFGKLPPQMKDGMDDEKDLFKPALKGERDKLDPRFEKKIRPTPKKKNSDDPTERRDALKEHQQDNLRDLDAAQKGLKSDEQTLEEMIQSLMKAAQQSTDDRQANPSGQSATDQLMQMLRSETMKSAKQMAQRARQGQPQPGSQPPTGTAADSLMGNSIGAPGILDDLDPRTRATILKLPARVREELLQGMKSQGPEGYEKFIQDYFRRLADVPK
jgi:phage shock protein A